MINTRGKYKKSSRKKLYSLLIVSALLITIGVLVLEKSNKISILGNKDTEDTNISDAEARTSSTAPSAQTDFQDGDDREPGTSVHENNGTGVIIDTQGNIPPSTDTSQPVSSPSGEITVYSPMKNSLIKSGQTIAGKSSLSKVTYRILDDVTGMIAMGELKVVNGRFSGTIEFDTSSEKGRIDVFITKSDGSEYSSVEIPVVFR